jgi:hypothetical protein
VKFLKKCKSSLEFYLYLKVWIVFSLLLKIKLVSVGDKMLIIKSQELTMNITFLLQKLSEFQFVLLNLFKLYLGMEQLSYYLAVHLIKILFHHQIALYNVHNLSRLHLWKNHLLNLYLLIFVKLNKVHFFII